MPVKESTEQRANLLSAKESNHFSVIVKWVMKAEAETAAMPVTRMRYIILFGLHLFANHSGYSLPWLIERCEMPLIYA